MNIPNEDKFIEEALFDWKNVKKVLTSYVELKTEALSGNSKDIQSLLIDFDIILQEQWIDMTPKQRKAISYSLRGFSQAEIGRKLGVTKQSIQAIEQFVCTKLADRYRKAYGYSKNTRKKIKKRKNRSRPVS
jgi:DNA-directed RNA polymerase specialized sigma24 family protein